MSDKSFSPQEGGCTCGRIRYRVLRKPMFIHCCHCTWCQRETGASFALNALLEAENVTLLKGVTESIDTPTYSGTGQKIVRCEICKIAVWSHYSGAGDAVKFVRVGTLDNPDLFPPDIHIFTSTKQKWLQLPSGIPVLDEYYRRSKYWPEQSIARYKLAIGS